MELFKNKKTLLLLIFFSFFRSLESETLKPWVPWKSEQNITFVAKWGKQGFTDTDLNFPQGIAVASNGDIYIADTGNHCIKKFTSDGKFIKKCIGKQKSKSAKVQEFITPTGIAVDSLGNIYVTDIGTCYVYKFNSDFSLLTDWRYKGTDSSEWNPSSIAVDGRNNIYITNVLNNEIQKFNSSGKFIEDWGSTGNNEKEFKWPHGISIGNRTRIYVADTFNHRIQRFTSGGSFLCEWGYLGSGKDQMITPRAVTTDGNGNVYVADTGNHRIVVYSQDGRYITSWGQKGSDNGEFRFPQGVAIDTDGSIYVLDTDNHRVQKFKGLAPRTEFRITKKSVQITNLAIADFIGKNVSSSDASIVADFLRTEFVGIGEFNVIDKANMDKLLAEASFQQTGCTTAECAIQIGKILNVTQVIVGSYSKLGNVYYITVNLVDVETGKILKSLDQKVASVSEIRDVCKIIAFRIIE